MARKHVGGRMTRIPIEDIDWTVSTYAVLKRNGIDFTDQIYKMSYEEITGLKNIHRRSVEEIEEILQIEFK